MIDAILWGIIQGLTEFLPISSSGHLVIVPALLDRPGPYLATSALLHLGTLVAVIVYFRSDLLRMAKFDRPARRMISLLLIGTVPAVVLGLLFEDRISDIVTDPVLVSFMLIVTGVVLVGTTLMRLGDRRTEDIRPLDSFLIGLAQAAALVPGISRSGMTMSAGFLRGLSRTESARFAFLLGIPVIAGAGFLEGLDLVSSGVSISGEVLVGMLAAGLSGYAAISLLLRLLNRFGLGPYGVYCVVVGALAAIAL